MNDFINGNKIVNEFISRLCPFLLSFFTMKMFQHFYKLDFQGLFQQVMFYFWQSFRNEKPVLFFIFSFFFHFFFLATSIASSAGPWLERSVLGHIQLSQKQLVKTNLFFLATFMNISYSASVPTAMRHVGTSWEKATNPFHGGFG